jgi:hypothetical protein
MKGYKSIYVQMAMSFVSGILLLAIPNKLIPLLGIEPTNEIWIYGIGLMALVLCFYYFQIAKTTDKNVVMGTVYGRLFFTITISVLAILGKAPLIFLPLQIFEFSLAIWSWRETKKEK